MTFSVKWHRRAIRQLAEAYVAAVVAGRGPAVTAAAAQIDSLLAQNPAECGESRDGTYRALLVVPLLVDFVVQRDRRRVVVRNVRYLPRRRR